MKKPIIYMGNYPNSANYDPNLPLGNNKWDEQAAWGDDEDDIEEEEDDDDDNEDLGELNLDY